MKFSKLFYITVSAVLFLILAYIYVILSVITHIATCEYLPYSQEIFVLSALYGCLDLYLIRRTDMKVRQEL